MKRIWNDQFNILYYCCFSGNLEIPNVNVFAQVEGFHSFFSVVSENYTLSKLIQKYMVVK